ncbi:MAG: hypothetical protein CVV11_13790 [Gammaproteobacteria bacterium HGW-Gammaproteobacteria-15]|nr:MAG: hypothetical protein CVV11_13790 [Gammaproteobacteria bacterium HGW-Gammaproteobacteria-15]
MPKKTVVGEYQGHKITVENTWFGGAKLFHNNDLVATNNDFFAVKKSVPLMSGKITINGVEHLIQVFGYALITVKLQIKINGKYLAGDRF